MKNTKGLPWILLALTGVCALVLIVIFVNGTGRVSLANSATQAESLSINHFRPIQGTSIFVATVAKDSGRFATSSARAFSFDSDYAVPNLVFLDGNTLSSHTLFDTNDNAIIGISQFPIPSADPTTQQVEVKWLVYEIVEQDTNSDGTVNSKDSFVLAISSVNGLNYTELITNIDKIYGMNLLESQVLLVVYATKGEYLVSKIDLEQQIIIETQALTQVPLGKAP